MAGFVEVAKVEQLPPGTAMVVAVEGKQLALVNVAGTFCAVDNECSHRGGWMGEGTINDDWSEWALECPLHGSVFDVRTGEVLNPPAGAPLRTYPVQIDAGVVKVLAE
ncbi:MAG: Rieske (2Fe-2S) protein [Acidimicrobiales bacterium]